MNRMIMVDTAGWYALADLSDQYHQPASEFYLQSAGRQALITTNVILLETWTLINARLGKEAALAFWSRLRNANFPIIYSDQSDMEGAWHIANTYLDQSFSLVDCLTMSAMERRGISRVFTFDQHFHIFRYGPGCKYALEVLP